MKYLAILLIGCSSTSISTISSNPDASVEPSTLIPCNSQCFAAPKVPEACADPGVHGINVDGPPRFRSARKCRVAS